MTYARPWRSYAEQLELLKSRGISVSNNLKALRQLENIGYYRLSAYWYPFRSFQVVQEHNSGKLNCIRADRFVAGTQFSDAVALYKFDKQLRLLLMDALERIEIALRVDLAYLLGARDTYAHLTSTAFHPSFALRKSRVAGKTAFDVWQEKYNGLLKRSKEDFVKHYRARHGPELPIWVAVEVWDFGAISQLLTMMKVQDQQHIAHKYGVGNWRVFQSWLRSLNYLRNLVAHHSRVWNRNIIDQPRLPARSEIAWCDAFIDSPELVAKPFILLAIALHLMGVVAPDSLWHLRLRQHLDNFPLQNSSQKLSVEDAGAPDTWRDWWGKHIYAGK